MKFKESRAAGYAAIFVTYAFAISYGVAAYLNLPLDFRLSLLIADVTATVVTFIFSVMFKNASVYDPYWSVQPLVIAIAFAATAPALKGAQILALIAISLWSVRLTANWAYTFKGLAYEDWRYVMLAAKTGRLYPAVNFFGIHLVPTLIVYACTLPAVYILRLGLPFNAGSAVFFALSLGAVILQGAADVQMHAFKKRGGKGFIRTGLWKYCRHPNYLGEILFWWGIALMAVCSSPKFWYLPAGALANTLMFLFISIPLAEKKQALKPGYAQYKAETRMLLPIKKRS